MAYPTYKLVTTQGFTDNPVITHAEIQEGNVTMLFPMNEDNRHYRQYLEDLKMDGMSIVSCDDCGDGLPNDSMWQYIDNAEELLVNKYGSDQDKLTALREDRYVRAMEAKFPYESMTVAGSVIDNTPQIIKDKYRHLPMRR